MRIPPNVILIWAGANAAIPSGYSRETSLDGLFLKAWGAVAPNNTGGAATHTHTRASHTHSINSHTHTGTTTAASGAVVDSSSGGNASQDGHTHTFTSGGTSGTSGASGTVNLSAASNLPTYYEVIFIKSGGATGLPDDVIALFDKTTIPSGWQECNGLNGSPDLRGKYLRGAGTGNDAGATGGSNTHNHTASHNHSISHSHTGTTGGSNTPAGYRHYQGGATQASDYNHSHNFTLSTANETSDTYNETSDSQSNEPVYKKLIAIQNQNGRFDKPKYIIGLWLGATADIPKGWVLCDGSNGTYDLRNYFLKIGQDSSQLGNTGGANSHQHGAIAHTHNATSSHSHTGSVAAWGGYGNYGGGSLTASLQTHTHSISTTSSQTTSLASGSLPATSTDDNQPPYRTVAFIQFQKEIYGGGVLAGFL